MKDVKFHHYLQYHQLLSKVTKDVKFHHYLQYHQLLSKIMKDVKSVSSTAE